MILILVLIDEAHQLQDKFYEIKINYSLRISFNSVFNAFILLMILFWKVNSCDVLHSYIYLDPFSKESQYIRGKLQ